MDVAGQQVLLFFILPIKMKWMGIAAAAMWVLEFLTGNFASRVSLLFGIAGFLAFFGGEMFTTAKDAIVSYKRRKDWEKNQPEIRRCGIFGGENE